MSASMSSGPIRAKTNKSKKVSLKTVLCDSQSVTWPKIDNKVQEEILRELKSTIEPLEIAKIKSSGKKKTPSESLEVPTFNKEIRSQLLIGVNQVTKGLEKNDVQLVLTCHSAQPPAMIHHLIRLAASRECPAACLHGLSTTLGPVLNLKSTLAVGFKKISGEEDQVFSDLVSSISEKIPKLSIPHIDEGAKQREITVEDTRILDKESVKTDKCQSSSDTSQSQSEKSSQVLDGNSAVEDSLKSSPNKQPQKDYSIFYVYKKDSVKKNKIHSNDFIALSDNGSTSSSTELKSEIAGKLKIPASGDDVRDEMDHESENENISKEIEFDGNFDNSKAGNMGNDAEAVHDGKSHDSQNNIQNGAHESNAVNEMSAICNTVNDSKSKHGNPTTEMNKKGQKRKAESQTESFIKFSRYEPASVVRVKPNENRKHKKGKKLKKK